MKGKLLSLALLSASLCLGSASSPSILALAEDAGTAEKTAVNPECTVLLATPSAEVELGSTFQIHAASSAGEASFSYASLNEAVASVDENGLVKAKSLGKTAVKVSTASDYAYFRIEVVNSTAPKVEGLLDVSVEKDGLNLLKSQTYQLRPVTQNEGREMTNATYSYSSSDASVASVDANGLIEAKGAGEAKVTVTALVANVSATAEVEVKVTAPTAFLAKNFHESEAVVNHPIILDFVLLGYEGDELKTLASGAQITLSSGDETIAKVEKDSGSGLYKLFGLRKGEAAINAEATHGGETYRQTFTLRVREEYSVKFMSDGKLIHEETVLDGDGYAYEETPTAKDKFFDHWDDGEGIFGPSSSVDKDLTLTAKWLVESDDLTSTRLNNIYEYSNVNDVVVDNAGGCFLYQDFSFPLATVELHIKGGKVLNKGDKFIPYNITLPRLSYQSFPAVSFFIGGNYGEYYLRYTADGTNYVSSEKIKASAVHQFSVKNGTVWIDQKDTQAAVSDEVLSGAKGLTFQVYNSVSYNGGKTCLSGFYTHLSPED